ncbi:MAG: hypothetical protein QOG67_2499 [Verrucomicrobiota bacterium]|jgi:glycosyltransferase involved in cell wall biosynthesis
MVLLIGNYRPDQQQSMQRFGDMMLQGLTTGGIEAELVCPEPVLGNLPLPGRVFSKWLGYVDKYILFPFRLRRKLSKQPDVVHICDHSNAVYTRRCRPAPVLITCHDLLAVRGALGEETDCPASVTGRILQRWILRGLRRADVIACASRATEADAQRLVGTTGHPELVVVPLGLNYEYKKLSTEVARLRLAQLQSLDLSLPFVLHVGSNLRRKNRGAVLRIVALVKEKWKGQVVFAGDPLEAELLALAEQLGVKDRIRQVANASSESLEALYNCAVALLYPSRYEGFGWPVIEAQACGCPVICSTSGPLPEAAGDAGLYHALDDEAGFATDLLRLADPGERAVWSEKSSSNAERFSAKKMIAHYIDLYRRLGAEV